MKIKHFFDEATATLSYIVYEEVTNAAIVIDPVLNYDAAASSYDTHSIDALEAFINNKKLTLHTILETHAHADHLSGAQFLKERFPSSILAIGENIRLVQQTFKKVFNFKDFNENGIQFDRLLKDNETFKVGHLNIEIRFTPGHTPACSSYIVNQKAVFTGDVLFMHDFGTGRCDFPGGSAAAMYDSVTQRLYTLPDDVAVYVGHDYKPGGRVLLYKSTIGEQKKSNPQLNARTTREDFIHFRQTKDRSLTAPKLLLQSLQVNIDAGLLPAKEDNQTAYLKVPIKQNKKRAPHDK